MLTGYATVKEKLKRIEERKMTNLGINTKAGLSSLSFQNLMMIVLPVAKVATFAPQMNYETAARIQAAAKLAIALNEVK
jgi:hypothetical protein